VNPLRVSIALLVLSLAPAFPLVADDQQGGGHAESGDREGHSHGGDEKGHMQHSFEDAERWAAMFESSDRDEWQQPDDVIRFLDLSKSSVIADIGSATGYFPVRFSPRVPDGKVYGIDIEPDMVRYLNERARREGLGNVTSILCEPDDPLLPEPVDLVFICNTYHHIGNRVDYLRRLAPKLRSGGRIAIVDFKGGELPVGPPPSAKISPQGVIEEFERAGYALLDRNGTLPYQYMLMFGLDKSAEIEVTPATLETTISGLISEFGAIPSGSRFILLPGEYQISPGRYIDQTCGNCEDPQTEVSATVGLQISGLGISLEGGGANPEDVVIRTNAGYGLLFQDCRDCAVRNLKITGGVRDRDYRATDGAIVVKRSSVTVRNCLIEDNIGEASTVGSTMVGIIGIVGREGADITILGNRIVRNSWDGIALYRGAYARIEDNLIDGVDLARGRNAGGGRGVGIGVTWDSKALIQHNLIRRYWKGIGIFVDADCDVRENVVEEMLTWGIAYWDAGKGRPAARIERNIVFNTGACGITITRKEGGDPAPGLCRGNLLIRTGQNPEFDSPEQYCRQAPVAVAARPDGFDLGGNIRHNNRRPGYAMLNDDLGWVEFKLKAGSLMEKLAVEPALRQSAFFRDYR